MLLRLREHYQYKLFSNIQKAAKAALGELSIQYWPTQIDKVIQLNSTLQVRHGVMIVGPAGGGKTTTRQILKRALVVLPTIQAREQQQPLGTGDYPEETGSTKTSLSFAVRIFTYVFLWFSQHGRVVRVPDLKPKGRGL